MRKKWTMIIVAGCLLFALLAGATSLVVFGGMSANDEATATQECTPSGGDVEPAPDDSSDGGLASKVSIDGQRIDAEQSKNASIIRGVGKARGHSTRDIAIAIATAIQESNLRNLHGGDRDSLGIYQQRPSIKGGDGKPYWGTPSQIMDVVYATNRFYREFEKKVKNPDSMTMIEVAIKIQAPSRSAYYSRWKWDAIAMKLAGNASGKDYSDGTLAQQAVLGSVTGDCLDNGQITGTIENVVQAALSQIGEPYTWGGESEVNGFDCSGLMQWAYAKIGVKLPRVSRDQYNAGDHIRPSDMQRGDMVFWAHNTSDPSTIFHVALYLGNNQIIEAPRPGKLIGIHNLYWQDHIIGAVRVHIPAKAGMEQSAKWQMPLRDGYRISSPFGMRFHPTKHVWKLHDGVDMAAPTGTPIYAASSGTIIRKDFTANAYGNYVVIDHGNGIQTGYAHMNAYAPNIGVGTRVTTGQLLGYVGMTGPATGPHLHFNVKVNGEWKEPLKFMQGKTGQIPI